MEQMVLRLKLPGGTLKWKAGEELRHAEYTRRVPVWRLGKRYLIWWPDSVPDRHRQKVKARVKKDE